MARFQREAQAASAQNHPNICTIYDDDGHAYIVMAYLDGVTLRYKIGGWPLELEETLRYAIEIVERTRGGTHCWDHPPRYQNGQCFYR